MRRGLLLMLLALPPAGLTAADAAAAAWQALAAYRPAQALPQFEQLAARGGPGARAARFGEALSLLAQPLPVANRVERAQALLEALAADGDDDLALGARFYLGRLAEFQADPLDPRRAGVEFRRLIAGHPDSVWAQAAVPRLALLVLYTAAGPAAPAARIAEAERLLPDARTAAAEAELRLVIADAVFHYLLPDALARPHLVALARCAVLDATTRADVLVQAGEVSRLTGHPAEAAGYYRTFLAEYPREPRQFQVRLKLAQVAGP